MSEPLFNPLNGAEFKQIVMESISRAFDNTGEFGEHVTFPKVSWDFRLELKVYPSPIPERIVLDKGIITKSEPSPASIDAARVITFDQKEGVDTPDLAREQNALPIPTPSVGPDGIIADKAVYSPREPEPAPVNVTIKLAKPPSAPPAETASGPSESSEAPVLPAGGVSDEIRDAIYANPPIPREAARSVVIETRANPGGAKPGNQRAGK